MKKFISSLYFQTGAFLAFVLTTIAFTFILTAFYTPNELLEHNSFYRDGKVYKVLEQSQIRRKCVNE